MWGSSVIHLPLNGLVEGGLWLGIHRGHRRLIRRECSLEVCVPWRRVRERRGGRLGRLMLLKTGLLGLHVDTVSTSGAVDVVPLRSAIVGVLELGVMPPRLVASRGFRTVRLERRSSLPAGVA